MEFSVSADFSELAGFLQRSVQSLQQGTGDSDIRQGLENSQATFLGAERQRFTRNSRGGGEWADIKPSTKLARLHRAGGKLPRQSGISQLQQVASLPFPILYEKADLYTSLYPGEPYNIFETTRDSVIAGTSVHHAIYHQSDEPRTKLPQRKILHQPDTALLGRMTEPIVIGIRAMIIRAIFSGGPSLARSA